MRDGLFAQLVIKSTSWRLLFSDYSFTAGQFGDSRLPPFGTVESNPIFQDQLVLIMLLRREGRFLHRQSL